MSIRIIARCAAVCGLLCGASALRAQCETWFSTGGAPWTNGPVRALTTIDFDGAGAAPPRLVMGGTFTIAGGVAVNGITFWAGQSWKPLNGGVAWKNVWDLLPWDPDGPGPQLTVLVAAGSQQPNGVGRIARWDGATWKVLGAGGGDYGSLAAWDPDGPGPAHPMLIASGTFTQMGGVTARRIAAFDGLVWHALGAGLDSPAMSLATWDPDGNGPAHELLIAGGYFGQVGSGALGGVVSWDGTQWKMLGAGINDLVYAVETFDPDGAGPAPAVLVAGGAFSSAGNVAAQRVAQWNGSAWQPLGGGISNSVYQLRAWDADGGGPVPPQLLAAGPFGHAGGLPSGGLARWNGSTWQAFNPAPGFVPADLASWDADGAGPLPVRLVAAGDAPLYPERPNIRFWNGVAWHHLGVGLTETVDVLAAWDEDGPGPIERRLVVAQNSCDPIYGCRDRVAQVRRWDGARWLALAPMSTWVNAMTEWDADGAGPGPERLVAGTQVPGTHPNWLNRVVLWSGSEWQPLGGDFGESPIEALIPWDTDESGPAAADLYAAGWFTQVGSAPARSIARWDGAQWHALGAGVGGGVYTMVVWDRDGPGGFPSSLVVAGDFDSAGGDPAANIARWDGLAWHTLGTGVAVPGQPWNDRIEALVSWDPDGSGPGPASVVAFGRFVLADGKVVNNIARWDGSEWHPLGVGVTLGSGAYDFSLATWDPDGPGQYPAYLLASGDVVSAGAMLIDHTARWDGFHWHNSPAGGVRMTTWDPDGPGPINMRLGMARAAPSIAGAPSAFASIWGCPGELPCYPDCNSNGFFGGGDFACFRAKFDENDAYADCNGDLALTIADFTCFQRSFVHGCP